MMRLHQPKEFMKCPVIDFSFFCHIRWWLLVLENYDNMVKKIKRNKRDGNVLIRSGSWKYKATAIGFCADASTNWRAVVDLS